MFKTTIIGGVLFLLPLVVLVLLLGKAFEIAKRVAAPIEQIIPVERLAGIALINILAILMILVVCYVAGILARRPMVRDRVTALDEMMMRIVPVYALVKTMITSVARLEEEADTMRPVMVRLDDAASIGFEVERNEDTVVVFIPGSPSPWSGSTMYVVPERITPLNVSSHQVAKTLQMLGRGSLDAFDRPNGKAADNTAPGT